MNTLKLEAKNSAEAAILAYLVANASDALAAKINAEERAEAEAQARRDRANRARARREKLREARQIEAAIAKVRKQLERVEKIRGPFSVYLPATEADLRHEGKRLHHCVGQYGNAIARGTSVIVFVRTPDAPTKPFVTVEFSPEENEITQCYARNNTKPDQPVLDFVYGALQTKIRRLYKKAS